jgi:uncharacterized protein YgbK (DUF1537 family)
VPRAHESVAVLDDDPTGVQTLTGACVLLEWTKQRVESAFAGACAVHVLTNSRAYPAGQVGEIVGSAAGAVLSADPVATIVLRGDSTLRGHVLEEYLALRAAKGAASFPPLVLAPALPSAGRVTVGGVQYLERDGERIPVHRTEFASDSSFAYSSSRLLEWAEERTDGLFVAEQGIEVGLERLRRNGPDALVAALQRAASAAAPTAVAVDSETEEDIDVVAEGFRRATASGDESVLRCGPALAGALGRATAAEPAELPRANQVLLVCGSYVSQSVRQLEQLAARFPGSIVAVDPFALVRGDEASTIVAQLRDRLDASGLAVLAVTGPRVAELSDLSAGLSVARGLAATLAGVDRPQALVVLKGGVTSAVALRAGLGASQADIVGPVLPGVALWQIVEPSPRSVLVVPGNVGEDDLLVRIVEGVRGP